MAIIIISLIIVYVLGFGVVDKKKQITAIFFSKVHSQCGDAFYYCLQCHARAEASIVYSILFVRNQARFKLQDFMAFLYNHLQESFHVQDSALTKSVFTHFRSAVSCGGALRV